MLAIAGDGGFQYGIAELATAKQHELDAALLVIDDGGYGILREYQASSGFAHTAVDLEHPDLIALAAAYDIPARRSSANDLARDLDWALSTRGPAIVVLEATLAMPEPSHFVNSPRAPCLSAGTGVEWPLSGRAGREQLEEGADANGRRSTESRSRTRHDP